MLYFHSSFTLGTMQRQWHFETDRRAGMLCTICFPKNMCCEIPYATMMMLSKVGWQRVNLCALSHLSCDGLEMI